MYYHIIGKVNEIYIIPTEYIKMVLIVVNPLSSNHYKSTIIQNVLAKSTQEHAKR